MNKKVHIDSLDGLRTMAIACVIVTHYATVDSIVRRIGIDWAVIGVHTFFVLSGFLITKLLIEKYYVNDSFLRGLGAFWIARIFRIVPLAFVAIGAVTLAAGGALPKSFYTYNLTFTSNFYTAKTNDWLPATGHFWTLAIEMQFYLLYPFFVWAFRKRLLVSLVCALAALLLLQETIAQLSGMPGYPFLLPARADAFLWGGILYYLSTGSQFKLGVRLMLLVGGIVYLGQSMSSLMLGTPQFVPELIIGNVLFAGIVGVTMIPGSFVNNALSNRYLVHIGRISYGVYVWHEIARDFIFFWTNGLKFATFWPLRIAMIIATLCLAECSWFLFEKALNSLGVRLSNRVIDAGSKNKSSTREPLTRP